MDADRLPWEPLEKVLYLRPLRFRWRPLAAASAYCRKILQTNPPTTGPRRECGSAGLSFGLWLRRVSRCPRARSSRLDLLLIAVDSDVSRDNARQTFHRSLQIQMRPLDQVRR